jgi:hypothetical protein
MSVTALKLSSLLGAHAVDERGRSIGRVHDVRVRRVAPGGPAAAPVYEVEGLVLGARGVLARLGALGSRRAQAQPIAALPWRDVVAVEPGRVVVRERPELDSNQRPSP